ncbi:hydroxyphenylacetyl-CoA thioesterase PaaI [Streptomyces sp. NPDC014889]|uniref:hydroxyphenylacetyl-CoA thioesterase PaaI n=1 Tax=Streptomyces sp. NPDC014889 TaxID=3364928 RepID=UPI0037002327
MTQATDVDPGPVETMFAADLASRNLGIELTHHGEGTAEVRMTVTPAMVNGHRIAHGGYLFLLADTAFACACNSHGPVTVAAAADIVFIAPAYEGDVLVATACERTRYGRSGIYDVSVRRIDGGPGEARSAEGGDGRREGEVIAEFRGRSRSLRSEKTSEKTKESQ